MKKKEFCPHCGQSIMKHEHTFSMSLAKMILLVSEKFEASEPFHLQKDFFLTKNQYNNFQKLKYWGLISKAYKNGKREGGYWVLTDQVGYLLRGGALARSVITFNNTTIGWSPETITLKEAIGYYDMPEIWADRSTPVTALQEKGLF